jgi:hypothetical protein
MLLNFFGQQTISLCRKFSGTSKAKKNNIIKYNTIRNSRNYAYEYCGIVVFLNWVLVIIGADRFGCPRA